MKHLLLLTVLTTIISSSSMANDPEPIHPLAGDRCDIVGEFASKVAVLKRNGHERAAIKAILRGWKGLTQEDMEELADVVDMVFNKQLSPGSAATAAKRICVESSAGGVHMSITT